MSYTWNIMFIAIDNNSIEQDKKLIVNTKNRFITELNTFKSKQASQNIRVSLLEYFNKGVDGKAKFSFYNNSSNLFEIEENDFNCQEESSFEKFFNFSKNKFTPNINQEEKNLIVFLAHCTSLSFFETRDLNTTYQGNEEELKNYKYFSVLQLRDAIKNVFGENGIEALLALNCTFQNFENNYALRETVKYLIGSEQPLAPRYINFESFLKLINNVKLIDDDTWKRVLHNFYTSYERYIVNHQPDMVISENENYNEFISFQLSLTKPFLTNSIYDSLNSFSSSISLSKNKYYDSLMNTSKTLIEDPSINNVVGMIDAIQYFGKLKNNIINYYESLQLKDNEGILFEINTVIIAFENLILLNLKSQNADIIKLTYHKKNVFQKKYIPKGIAFFLPSQKSVIQKITEHIWFTILNENNVNTLNTTKNWVSKVKLNIIFWLTTGNPQNEKQNF